MSRFEQRRPSGLPMAAKIAEILLGAGRTQQRKIQSASDPLHSFAVGLFILF